MFLTYGGLQDVRYWKGPNDERNLLLSSLCFGSWWNEGAACMVPAGCQQTVCVSPLIITYATTLCMNKVVCRSPGSLHHRMTEVRKKLWVSSSPLLLPPTRAGSLRAGCLPCTYSSGEDALHHRTTMICSVSPQHFWGEVTVSPAVYVQKGHKATQSRVSAEKLFPPSCCPGTTVHA